MSFSEIRRDSVPVFTGRALTRTPLPTKDTTVVEKIPEIESRDTRNDHPINDLSPREHPNEDHLLDALRNTNIGGNNHSDSQNSSPQRVVPRMLFPEPNGSQRNSPMPKHNKTPEDNRNYLVIQNNQGAIPKSKSVLGQPIEIETRLNKDTMPRIPYPKVQQNATETMNAAIGLSKANLLKIVSQQVKETLNDSIKATIEDSLKQILSSHLSQMLPANNSGCGSDKHSETNVQSAQKVASKDIARETAYNHERASSSNRDCEGSESNKISYPHASTDHHDFEEIQQTTFAYGRRATQFSDEQLLNALVNNHRNNQSNITQSSNNDHSLPPSTYRQSSRKVKLEKWPFRYDGKNMPVSEFVFRVETMKAIHQYTWEEVVKHFSVLLKGQAEVWFWRYLKQVRNPDWFQVKSELSNYFKSITSDHELIRQIMDRKQGPKESFEDFYNAMMFPYFTMRNQLPENEMVLLIKRNLRRDLAQLVFTYPVSTLSELREQCRKAEDLMRNWEPRSTKAYDRRVAEMQVHESSDEDSAETDLNIDEIQKSRKNLSKLTCWNCDQSGHTFVECCAKRKIFCYRCGRKNTYVPDCPKCSQGNGKAKEKDPGVTPSDKLNPVA